MFAWKPGCALDIDCSRAFLVQQRGTLFSDPRYTYPPLSLASCHPVTSILARVFGVNDVFAILLPPSRDRMQIFLRTRGIKIIQHKCSMHAWSSNFLVTIYHLLLKVSPLEEKVKMNELQNDIKRFLLIPFRFRFYRENKGWQRERPFYELSESMNNSTMFTKRNYLSRPKFTSKFEKLSPLWRDERLEKDARVSWHPGSSFLEYLWLRNYPLEQFLSNQPLSKQRASLALSLLSSRLPRGSCRFSSGSSLANFGQEFAQSTSASRNRVTVILGR